MEGSDDVTAERQRERKRKEERTIKVEIRRGGRREGRRLSLVFSSYRYIYVLISHEEDEAAEALSVHASVSHY